MTNLLFTKIVILRFMNHTEIITANFCDQVAKCMLRVVSRIALTSRLTAVSTPSRKETSRIFTFRTDLLFTSSRSLVSEEVISYKYEYGIFGEVSQIWTTIDQKERPLNIEERFRVM